MQKIAGDKSSVWESNRAGSEVLSSKKSGRRKSGGPAPRFVKPMKATAVTHLPEGEEWIYEVKWDGYRVLALKQGENVRLLSLKERDLTTDFPAVAAAVRTIGVDTAVIDGEVVAIDSKGCPSFQALQNRATTGPGWQILYYAFELLNLQGEDWTKRPLHKRKAKLRDVLNGSDVRFNADLEGEPKRIIQTIKEAGLEGVIAKKRDSAYRARTRVDSWLTSPPAR